MFGTSGIRGPVGETVTADLALSVGRALGVDTARVVVGRDTRESGDLLVDALTAGLREQGTDVIDLGLAATPTVARGVEWEKADAGVSITASHNPAEDNGFKLWQPSGQAFDEPLQKTITKRVQANSWSLNGWAELGSRERTDVTKRHVETLVDRVDLPRPLSVVVDLGNGAGEVGPTALAQLGCTVETLNAQPDGAFPGRPSEPTPEHCRSLAALVKDGDAELGIAHDGDADRMRAVAADGTYLSGDVLLAVLAGAAADSGDRVAIPVDTSLAVEDFLADRGVTVERTPVGDVFVARAVADGAAFGGEPSGSWIWGTGTLCPDGLLAAVKLAELAAEQPLIERVRAIPDYPIRRANMEVEDKTRIMEVVTATAESSYDDVTTMDGVRVGTDDGWFLVRASGTQPLIRVTAEARKPSHVESLVNTAQSLIEQASEDV
jgi:phosphoglucosamine mutase